MYCAASIASTISRIGLGAARGARNYNTRSYFVAPVCTAIGFSVGSGTVDLNMSDDPKSQPSGRTEAAQHKHTV